MTLVGDDQAGFSIGQDPTQGTIQVKGWGFWNVEVALAFGPSVMQACRQQRGATLALDLSTLKPMREEGQRSFRELMRRLASLGVSRTSITSANPLTKLQLVRLATEAEAGDGIEWITAIIDSGRNA